MPSVSTSMLQQRAASSAWSAWTGQDPGERRGVVGSAGSVTHGAVGTAGDARSTWQRSRRNPPITDSVRASGRVPAGRGPVAGAQAQNGRQYGRCRRSRFESRPRIRSASTEHVHRRDRHSLAERIAQAEVNKRKCSESVSAIGGGGERRRRARLPSRKEAQLRCKTCANKTGRRPCVEQDCDASGPCRVGRRPDKRGLQSGLGPCHGQNSGATRRRGTLRPHGRCEVRR